MRECEICIIGAGVAGMTAACVLGESSRLRRIILIERESEPGGVLAQCIHAGFGEENQTGPQYKDNLWKRLRESDTQLLLGYDVTEIHQEQDSYLVKAFSEKEELQITAQYLILATGCYERSWGNLLLGGTRPEGIFSAGELQRMINLEGYQPEKEAVVIGSGDIGLIIARRLLLKGCRVKRILEIQGQCPALQRNKAECLDKYQLPLQVHSRVTQICGEEKVTGVTIEDLQTGKREQISCDLVVVAAGLIPDRTLIYGLEHDEKLILIGNCERIYPSVEGIVHTVTQKCSELLS